MDPYHAGTPTGAAGVIGKPGAQKPLTRHPAPHTPSPVAHAWQRPSDAPYARSEAFSRRLARDIFPPRQKECTPRPRRTSSFVKHVDQSQFQFAPRVGSPSLRRSPGRHCLLASRSRMTFVGSAGGVAGYLTPKACAATGPRLDSCGTGLSWDRCP